MWGKKKKNHLWKGFKVGKDNRGFKVLRRELFSFGARIVRFGGEVQEKEDFADD